MATSDLVTGIFVALAVVRIIRIVAVDTITEPARIWVVNRLGAKSMLVELIYCPWCLGWWASIGLVLFAKLGGLISSWPAALVMIPACAYGAAIISMRAEKE